MSGPVWLGCFLYTIMICVYLFFFVGYFSFGFNLDCLVEIGSSSQRSQLLAHCYQRQSAFSHFTLVMVSLRPLLPALLHALVLVKMKIIAVR